MIDPKHIDIQSASGRRALAEFILPDDGTPQMPRAEAIGLLTAAGIGNAAEIVQALENDGELFTAVEGFGEYVTRLKP